MLKEVGLARRPVERIGDKGPGSEESQQRRGVDGVKLLFDLLSLRRSSTAGDLVSRRRPPLPDLPPMDFEPLAPPIAQGGLPPLKRVDREKLIKAMRESIAEEFRRRVSRGQAPVSGVDIKKLFSRSPLPALRFETQPPPKEETFSQMLTRFLQEPPPREETFSEKLMRHLQTPKPREETFSEKLERYLKEPPDFRTEGEKRRDERQAAARQEPPRPQPSPMDSLLAQLEAGGKKGRKAKAPSSKKRKANEVWEKTTAQAKKLNALRRRIEAGEAHPLEEVFATAALPDSLAELSPKLEQSRAGAREKVLSASGGFEKGDIPEVVPLGEGASFEQDFPKLPGRLFKVPKSVSDLPDIEGRFFKRVKEIDGPSKLAREILLASPLDEYLDAGKNADEFTDRMLKEGIVGKVEKKGVRNALEHFIAAYTITREFGSPRLTWTLGVFQEVLISPITGRLAGSTKDEIARDTEIDYYHNELGIQEAVKHSGKDVPLYELVKRLAKEGKFRY